MKSRLLPVVTLLGLAAGPLLACRQPGPRLGAQDAAARNPDPALAAAQDQHRLAGEHHFVDGYSPRHEAGGLQVVVEIPAGTCANRCPSNRDPRPTDYRSSSAHAFFKQPLTCHFVCFTYFSGSTGERFCLHASDLTPVGCGH